MMSAAVEQSRRKKRRMVVSPSPTCWLMSLPDDMILNCLARVSRSDHGALSLVSKSSRSLVVSPGLYETRSRMGLTEDCIYVCLDTPLQGHPPRWFILRREKGKSFENRLIPIPSLTTPNSATFVPLGGGVYVIGGTISAKPTSRVSFLDCRTHTWSVVPSMRVARAGAIAGVLDGKIYVMGGLGYDDPSDWAEVFDPKMQTWSRGPIPDLDLDMSKEVRKVVGPESFFFDFRSEGCMWNDLINTRDASCELDKLLYSCDLKGRVMWCDPWSGVRKGRMEWYRVNGLENMEYFLINGKKSNIIFHGENRDVWHCYMLKRGYRYGLQGLIPGFKLSKSGGKLFIFWGVHFEADPKRLQVWCAEILLERRHGGQIWGIVQCFDHVFTLDDPLLHVLYSVNVNL